MKDTAFEMGRAVKLVEKAAQEVGYYYNWSKMVHDNPASAYLKACNLYWMYVEELLTEDRKAMYSSQILDSVKKVDMDDIDQFVYNMPVEEANEMELAYGLYSFIFA